MIVSCRLYAGVGSGDATRLVATPSSHSAQPLPGLGKRAALLYSRHSRSDDRAFAVDSSPPPSQRGDATVIPDAISAALDPKSPVLRSEAGEENARDESAVSGRLTLRKQQPQCPGEGPSTHDSSKEEAPYTCAVAALHRPPVPPERYTEDKNARAPMRPQGIGEGSDNDASNVINVGDDATIECDSDDVDGDECAGGSASSQASIAYRAVPAELWREEDEDGSPTAFDFDLAFSFLHEQFLELRRTDQRLAGQLVALRRAIAQANKAHGPRSGAAASGRAPVGGGGRSPRRGYSQRCRDDD